MSVKIRLRRAGCKNRPFYEVVVTNSTVSRNGKCLEKIGTYNPFSKDIVLSSEKSMDWMSKGAKPTDAARRILSKKGVLFKRHLQIGVDKGAITQDAADQKFADWEKTKEVKKIS